MDNPVVKVSTSRGRLLLGENSHGWSTPQTVALTEPVDDLLGLDIGDVESWSTWWMHLLRYGSFWGSRRLQDVPRSEFASLIDGEFRERDEAIGDSLREWAAKTTPHFLEAVRVAEDARVPSVLAPELQRVRYRRGYVEVPEGDLPALATRALLEAVRSRPVVVRDCPLCRRPWITTRGQEYCLRPAPGYTRACREIAKEARFLANPDVRDYRREYKRLHELKRRGTISMAELNAWRQGNEPSAWAPYTQWLETKKGATNDG